MMAKQMRSRVFKRGHSWVADVRLPGGRRVRRAAGSRLDAEQLADQLQAGSVPTTQSPTVKALCEAMLTRQHIRSKPASVATAGYSLKPVLEYLGKVDAAQLTAANVERFIAWRLETVSRE
ncbi:MAG: hypothetical protein V3U03_12360, partial [Myxococcota bacterium]